MINKLQLLEQEIVDLKNQNKQRLLNISSHANNATGFGVIDGNRRLDLLIEEVN